MYFLETEASNHGTDPAALEPATESRKEGSVQEFGRGRFFSLFLLLQMWRKDEKTTTVTMAAVGQTQIITKTTKMTGYWKWGVPYPRLGIWQILFYTGRRLVQLHTVAQTWHRFAKTKQNKTERSQKKPLNKDDNVSWGKQHYKKRKEQKHLGTGHWGTAWQCTEDCSLHRKQDDPRTEGLEKKGIRFILTPGTGGRYIYMMGDCC